MPTNQQWIEKATITTDVLAAQGKLLPAQADKFLDYVFDETGLAKAGVRTVKFRNEQMILDKIGVRDRVAMAAEEAQDPGLRRGVTTSKVTLEPKQVIIPFEIGQLFLEENLEGEAAADRVVQMMAKQGANNVESLYWDGNALGPAKTEEELVDGGSSALVKKDAFLGLFDGLLKQAEAGHVLDAQNGPLTPTLVSRAWRQLPTKFRTDKGSHRLMVSSDHESHFLEGVSARATQQGDMALRGEMMTPFGIPMGAFALLQPEPLYVENSVANSDGTTPTALTHGPIDNVIIAPTSLGSNPLAPYVEGVDYSLDKAAGTWTRLGGGSIGSGATVKVTYTTAGRILLTRPSNIILAIGRDVRIEKDRNIYRLVDEYAIHLKVDSRFEETDAVTLIRNVQIPV